jgi:Holliday junction resolvase RusA-like endonuclease
MQVTQSRYHVWVPGVPKPQGSLTLWSGGDGRERARYSTPTVAWRQTLHGALAAWWAGAPPLAGPVAVDLVFTTARPKAHLSARGGVKPSAPRWPTGRTGDIDKLCRAALDSLSDAGVWLDDALAVVLRAEKRYADPGTATGMDLTIKTLEG